MERVADVRMPGSPWTYDLAVHDECGVVWMPDSNGERADGKVRFSLGPGEMVGYVYKCREVNVLCLLEGRWDGLYRACFSYGDGDGAAQIVDAVRRAFEFVMSHGGLYWIVLFREWAKAAFRKYPQICPYLLTNTCPERGG
jgi:hypothetical protein